MLRFFLEGLEGDKQYTSPLSRFLIIKQSGNKTKRKVQGGGGANCDPDRRRLGRRIRTRLRDEGLPHTERRSRPDPTSVFVTYCCVTNNPQT